MFDLIVIGGRTCRGDGGAAGAGAGCVRRAGRGRADGGDLHQRWLRANARARQGSPARDAEQFADMDSWGRSRQ